MQCNWRACLPSLSGVSARRMAGILTCMPGALQGLAAVLGRSPRACSFPSNVIIITALLQYCDRPCT